VREIVFGVMVRAVVEIGAYFLLMGLARACGLFEAFNLPKPTWRQLCGILWIGLVLPR
jgi:hypothetical protein